VNRISQFPFTSRYRRSRNDDTTDIHHGSQLNLSRLRILFFFGWFVLHLAFDHDILLLVFLFVSFGFISGLASLEVFLYEYIDITVGIRSHFSESRLGREIEHHTTAPRHGKAKMEGSSHRMRRRSRFLFVFFLDGTLGGQFIAEVCETGMETSFWL